MLSREKRIELLVRLGQYILSDDEQWMVAQQWAVSKNAWFTPGHITLALQNIAAEYLGKAKLEAWIKQYPEVTKPVKVGVVMAGNIPLVGFHDFLCGFMSGHDVYLKLSSKDEVLLRHIIHVLCDWEPAVAEQVHIADNLKGCDAYIATGSNNTARYFEQYFAKYPHIIRRNRTSVAVLDGTETKEDLTALAHDVFSYFGLGCRNITQVCVPEGYNFDNLMEAMTVYQDMIHHHKYKNNYDYYLAIYLLNRVPYLTNESLLLVENKLPFSAVAVLHYRYYNDKAELTTELTTSDDIQSISGHGFKPFGTSQIPALGDYADGVDTMDFLTHLHI
ncbi:MAG: acyl-CoA reductase [Sphingobacteriales bacterium]|nr:MAG: acyl-CoA reductase [Sphingobacteriales bacterium]